MKKGFCVHAFASSLDAAAVTVAVAAVMEGERGCFMHASICILKAKALGTIAKKCKMGGVFRGTFTYSWRAEKKQRILEQIHVIIGEAPPPPHRSHFPPEDMRINDSLRCCRWNRDTDSMFTTHAISKQRGGGRAQLPVYKTCAVR